MAKTRKLTVQLNRQLEIAKLMKRRLQKKEQQQLVQEMGNEENEMPSWFHHSDNFFSSVLLRQE